jgi:hypothetical protein
VAADQTEGPFHVGTQTFTFVKHVQKINGSKSPDDSTVEWWELRDATGKAVFREQYQVAFESGTFSETEDVGARELKTRFGPGILVEWYVLAVGDKQRIVGAGFRVVQWKTCALQRADRYRGRIPGRSC